jgi:hypothetical protein
MTVINQIKYPPNTSRYFPHLLYIGSLTMWWCEV